MAQFNPNGHPDDSVSNASSMMRPSMHNSAQELLKRGEKIFGAQERDHKSSARFLVILLDSIENWSKIEVGDFAINKDRKVKKEQKVSSEDENEDEKRRTTVKPGTQEDEPLNLELEEKMRHVRARSQCEKRD